MVVIPKDLQKSLVIITKISDFSEDNYIIPKHMAMSIGDMNVAWLMARILFWQRYNIVNHGTDWVARTIDEWRNEYGIGRRVLENALATLEEKYGLERKVQRSKYHNGKAVLHVRFNPQILHQALFSRPADDTEISTVCTKNENEKNESQIKECTKRTLKNARNVHSLILENADFPRKSRFPYSIDHSIEFSKEKIMPKNSGEFLSSKIVLKRPVVNSDVAEKLTTVYSSEDGGKTKKKDEFWLNSICMQFWGTPLSDAQIEFLRQPVLAGIDTHFGYYPSPIELSNDPHLFQFFREWVLAKKNPSDPTIKRVGKKRWVRQHIANYGSPEGFLNYYKLRTGIALKPVSSVSVSISANRVEVVQPPREQKYNLELMYAFVYNTHNILEEALIPRTFRDFYQQNIERVSSNEEFKKLWYANNA